MPHAILFDLDQTLTDRAASLGRYAVELQQAFASQLRSTTPAAIVMALRVADGDGYRPRDEMFEELRQTLPWLACPDMDTLRTHWYTWFPRVTVARQGLHDTLRALHQWGIRLGVVTNGTIRTQTAKVEALGIHPYLAAVVISEALGVAKPEPQIFARAVAMVQGLTADTWFVGDHPLNDIVGAAAAGLRPIWLRGIHAWPTEYPEPTWQIQQLEEVVKLVQRDGHRAT